MNITLNHVEPFWEAKCETLDFSGYLGFFYIWGYLERKIIQVQETSSDMLKGIQIINKNSLYSAWSLNFINYYYQHLRPNLIPISSAISIANIKAEVRKWLQSFKSTSSKFTNFTFKRQKQNFQKIFFFF